MDIILGANAWSSDGQDLGKIEHLIVDPSTGAVKSAVIRKGLLSPSEVEVPLSALQNGSNGALSVTLTADQVRGLPRFERAVYAGPPTGYFSHEGYPSTALYWPIGFGVGLAQPIAEPTLSRDPRQAHEFGASGEGSATDRAVIGGGSEVRDNQGNSLGTVQHLSFDSATHEVTGIDVRKGVIFHENTQLHGAQIDSVDDGVITLKTRTE